VRFIVLPFTRRPLPRRPRSDLLRQTAPTSHRKCAVSGTWRNAAFTLRHRRNQTNAGEPDLGAARLRAFVSSYHTSTADVFHVDHEATYFGKPRLRREVPARVRCRGATQLSL